MKHWPLPDTQNVGLRMRWECRERFPRHRLQRKLPVSDPGMHHGTCVTHVPWCNVGIANTRWRGKRSRHSRRMRNPQFCASGKRPIKLHTLCACATPTAIEGTRKINGASNQHPFPFVRKTELKISFSLISLFLMLCPKWSIAYCFNKRHVSSGMVEI